MISTNDPKEGTMRTILIAILTAVSAVGCASSSKSFRGPNGEISHSITCRRTISNCYEEASRLCSQGYSMTDRTDESGIVPINGSFVTAIRYHMMVTCR